MIDLTLSRMVLNFSESKNYNPYLTNRIDFLNYMFGSGPLMKVQYPKCAYGPYR